MLRRMNDMPSGTIGFEAVGEVDDDDWEDVVEPCCALRSPRAARCGSCISWAARRGHRGRRREGRHRLPRPSCQEFERVAVVSDESWIKPALRVLSFLMPGGARGFAVRDLPAAKTWLAEGVETPS